MTATTSRRAAGSVFWASNAVLAYVHVGYPLMLELAARARRRPSTSPTSDLAPVTASIVICALDEADVIARKLEQTLALDTGGRPLDVVLVADGSADRTAEIARAVDDVRLTVLHEPERRGKAAAINRGVAAARGDVILFSDANNEWRPDAVVALLAAFDDPEVGGATGQKTVLQSATEHSGSEGWYWRYESWIRSRESELGSCTAANGEIMAIRRECFRPLPEDTVVDDLHMALEVMRSGRRFVAVPGAVSVEHCSPSEADERERRARMAAGRTRLVATPATFADLPPRVVWQLVSHKVGRLMVPVAMVALLASSWRASAGRPGTTRAVARCLLVAQSLGYGVVLAAPRVAHRWPSPLRAMVRALRYLVVSNVAVGAGLIRALRRRQSATWTRVAREGGS